MKILGIGEAVVDHISVMRRGDTSDATPELVESCLDAGGPVLSALILLARLGNDCTFVTSLGDDLQGEHIRETLRAEGVSLQVNAEKQTKRHTILVDELTGEREKMRGKVEHQPIKHVQTDLITTSELIVMDRHERHAFSDVLTYKQKSTQLVTDPSTEVSDFTLKMMQQSTFPILPIESLAELSEGRTLDEGLRLLHEACKVPFVVTLGDMGSLVFDGTKKHHIQPFAIVPVDTLGAGDVFRGAFAHGLSKGWTVLESATFGNAAAALQCTRHGNAAAVPTKDELETCHKNNVRRSVDLNAVEERFSMMVQNYCLEKKRSSKLFFGGFSANLTAVSRA